MLKPVLKQKAYMRYGFGYIGAKVIMLGDSLFLVRTSMGIFPYDYNGEPHDDHGHELILAYKNGEPIKTWF